jgi:hypothetical protein
VVIKIVCARDNLYRESMLLELSTVSAAALSRMFPRAHHEGTRQSWTRAATIRRNSERRLAQVRPIRRAGSENNVCVTRMSLFETPARLFDPNVLDRTDRLPADRLSCVRTCPRSHKETVMNVTWTLAPVVSLIAGVLILIVPRLLSYIVAAYLIIFGLLGLFGDIHLR